MVKFDNHNLPVSMFTQKYTLYCESAMEPFKEITTCIMTMHQNQPLDKGKHISQTYQPDKQSIPFSNWKQQQEVNPQK